MAPATTMVRTQPNGSGQMTARTIADYFKERLPSIRMVAAAHMDPERCYRILLSCWSRTPALQKCTPESLFRASLQAVELGLEPGGALGHAYLVPYGNQCTLIPGYRGLVELVRRSIRAGEVYLRKSGL
jgi:recombination protein RecT